MFVLVWLISLFDECLEFFEFLGFGFIGCVVLVEDACVADGAGDWRND